LEAKCGSFEKGIKAIGFNRDEISQKNSQAQAFWQQKERRKFGSSNKSTNQMQKFLQFII
jgi:hypothetical protein